MCIKSAGLWLIFIACPVIVFSHVVAVVAHAFLNLAIRLGRPFIKTLKVDLLRQITQQIKTSHQYLFPIFAMQRVTVNKLLVLTIFFANIT